MENIESFVKEEQENAVVSAEPETVEETIHSEIAFEEAENEAIQEVQEQQPAFDPNYRMPKKKRGGKVLKFLLCAVLIVALVFGSCVATMCYMDRMWEQKCRNIMTASTVQWPITSPPRKNRRAM